jgi:hypothetical protein
METPQLILPPLKHANGQRRANNDRRRQGFQNGW